MYCLALITFTDGRYIGAILDRNGLRPSRYYVSDDDIMYMSSEVGVVNIKSENVIEKGRLKAGRLLLVDTELKKIIDDEALKGHICQLRPVDKWMEEMVIFFDNLIP